MNTRVRTVIYILVVALGSVFISACPVDGERSVIWLVNATNEITYTTFMYRTEQGGSFDYEVTLPVSMAPREAYKLELDRSLVVSMTSVGMKGPGRVLNVSTVPGFGTGNADFLVDSQIGSGFSSKLVKSLN